MYSLDILFNQKSTARETLLLTVFNFLINSGVQFLRASTRNLPVFSTSLSNHSTKIIGNSPKKILCISINTYLCNHYSSLIHGFLFCSLENSRSFLSSHSVISLLVGLQIFPSVTNLDPNKGTICWRAMGRP
jgi:hypothetical protein